MSVVPVRSGNPVSASTASSGATRSANVAALLRAAATNRGDAPALVDAGGRPRWTFAGLVGAAARLAGALQANGLRPADRVALLVREPGGFVLAAAAVLWAGGAVVVPPRTRSPRESLRAAASLAPRAVIAGYLEWALAAAVPELRRAPVRFLAVPEPLARLVGTRSVAGALAAAPIEVVDVLPDDPALVSFTTGSTGSPKPVLRTHGVLRAQHQALVGLRRPLPGAVDLAGLPLLVLHNLASGVTSVAPPRGRPAHGASLRRDVRRLSVSTVAGFPALLEALVAGAAPGELPQVRAIQIGGAPVPADLLHRLRSAAPNAAIDVVYGATEAEPIAAISAEASCARDRRRRAGEGLCVGRPVAGVEVRIAPLPLGPDAEPPEPPGRVAPGPSGPVDVSAGPTLNAGRILVRGARVASGGAWLDTGDTGWLDAGGRLWLMGRRANVLRAAGGWLFPAQIEPVVEALDWVGAAALVNAAGTSGGGRAIVACEARARGSAAQRRRWQRELEALAESRGWPVGALVLPRLPRDARSGSKIDYPRLAVLAGRIARPRPDTDPSRPPAQWDTPRGRDRSGYRSHPERWIGGRDDGSGRGAG